MTPPLVSVIIPAFNAEAHLGRAIESVLAQTYPRVEILVVDDGSTDRTAAVCSGYGDLIRFVSQLGNLGVSEARNRGIEEARGEFIAFLDADDWYLPNKLFDLVPVLQKFPEAGGATAAHITKLANVSARHPPLHSVFSGPEQAGVVNLYEHRIHNRILIHTNTVLVRKSVFEALGGFRTDLRIGEDVEMWARIQGRYDWVYLDKEVCVYNRQSEASVTRNTPLNRHGLDFFYDDKQIIERLRPSVRPAYRQHRQLFCLDRARQGIKYGDRAFLRKCLALSAPPPLRLRWIAFAVASLLPDFIWHLAIRAHTLVIHSFRNGNSVS